MWRKTFHSQIAMRQLTLFGACDNGMRHAMLAVTFERRCEA